jgi:hypothetical protein
MWKGLIFMKQALLSSYNLDMHSQLNVLESIVMSNKIVREAIVGAKTLGINDYYIGAGCITQTVWNYLSDNPLD